ATASTALRLAEQIFDAVTGSTSPAAPVRARSVAEDRPEEVREVPAVLEMLDTKSAGAWTAGRRRLGVALPIGPAGVLAPALAGAAPLRALLRRLPDPDVERLLALVAQHLDLGVLSRARQSHGALQVGGRLHLLAVELEEDVAGLQAALARRAIGNDVGD